MAKTTPPQKVLRIGLFQNNRIIEERMLRTPESVTVGSSLKKNTFVVPVSNLPPSLTMFEHKNGQYALHITREMTGRIRVGGEVLTFQDIVRSGKAQKGPNGYVFPLGNDAQGRVVLDEATFLFQFVTPPPVRPAPVLPASMRGTQGWFAGLGIVLIVSMIVSAVFQVTPLVVLMNLDLPQPLESEIQIPDRFVQIMVEKKKEEPPKPEPEEKGDGDDKKEAAPVAKPVKKAAKPKAEPKEDPGDKPDDKPKKSLSPEEQAARELARKKRLAAKVRNNTILAALGTAGGDGPGIVNDVLKSGAGTESVDSAMSRSGGMTTAASDIERSGLKSGGAAGASGTGGTAGIGDIGKSRGASRAASAGVKTVKKKKARVKVKINFRSPAQTVGGTLDGASISRVLKRRGSQYQKCFERQLKKDPKAGGKVIVLFVIGTAGRVTSSRASTDSVGGGVGTCVAGIIQRLRFPRPKGGPATVKKTFVFSASR